jgi:hypothetical protein
LRIDQFGFIRPTLMVREKPFGTKLYDFLDSKSLKIVEITQTDEESKRWRKEWEEKQQESQRQFEAKNKVVITEEKFTRAMYDTHPRWKIDESMIYDVNVYTSEAQRINFVQVWGTNQYFTLASPQDTKNSQENSIERWKELQLLEGNMYADKADIARNGLRASVQDSTFDYPMPYKTYTPIWARIRADWFFNGHLKALGTVSLAGVKEPICEGDNAEIRGIVYHIESVTHRAVISGGKKTFTTELSLSNGITAYSLNNDLAPTYMIHMSSSANQVRHVPGTTDIQRNLKRNRMSDGELIEGIKK